MQYSKAKERGEQPRQGDSCKKTDYRRWVPGRVRLTVSAYRLHVLCQWKVTKIFFEPCYITF